LVYLAAAGAFLWMVLAAWVFFGGWDHMELNLAMVSILALMAGGIPFMLWRANVRARRRARALESVGPESQPPETEADVTEAEAAETFDAWIRGSFETWTGRRNARGAAVEILLPLGAAAVGMTALGIMFEIAQRHQI
jgi:membrane protein implicated in regulation of membrane protease activity